MGTLQWSNQFRVRSGVASLLVSGLMVLTVLPASSQSIRWFPELNETSGSLAWDISADGQVIVGSIAVSNGLSFCPFRWTRDGGYQLLSSIPGVAWSVSADGRVVVGSLSIPVNCAFRWTEDSGLELLPTLSSGVHSARDVSADGSVIVGASVEQSGDISATRWTAAGIESIVPGGQAWGVSADGTAVAGDIFVGDGSLTAFRWTETGGLQILSEVATAFVWDISADGSTVVGEYRTASGPRAFRWRPDSGELLDLGTLGGHSSTAYGTNNDGSVVLGSSGTGRGRRAFIWTEAEGMRDLNEAFPEVVSDGSVLVSVRAVSLDGRYIVGWGDRPSGRREAFVLDTWRFGATRPGNCIDEDDLLAVLLAFGTRGIGYTRHEDINKDGIVDDRDLLIVLSNFRRGCQ